MFERPAHQRTPVYPSALWPTSHHHRSPRSTRLYKGKSGKSCDYVAKKPSKYCDSEDDDGTTAGEACPMTCGNCGCQDSLTWLYKGKSGKDCGRSWRIQHTPPITRSSTLTIPSIAHQDYMKKKTIKCSKYKDKDGTKAKEACRSTCKTCA